MPRVLWWGRFDPDYSRNRVLRSLLPGLGWDVADFHPRASIAADIEARLRRIAKPDLVWVPCFRQRDLAAASRWARRQGIPLLFDPLISAYDKQVFERKKIPIDSRCARRLHRWERSLFERADIIVADTQAHADYFVAEFGIPKDRVHVVYVGAEESLFHPAPMPDHSNGSLIEVLFYGSFIELQAPQVIVQAARLYHGPPVRWTLLGNGPLRAECEGLARGLDTVRFEDAVPYTQLPARIHQADILLGVFDAGAKAGRVIPNKVFQSLACGRPVVTRRSAAYPAACRDNGGRGLFWVDPCNPGALAQAVAKLALQLRDDPRIGQRAVEVYRDAFSGEVIAGQLRDAMAAAGAS